MTGPRHEALEPAAGVTVGRVVGVHGLRGEVKVEPLSDFPERFEPGAALWLDGRRLRVEGSRWQRRLVYLKLEGVDSRSDAVALAGRELCVPELLALVQEGVYYQHDVIGLSVVDAAGETLGRVSDILSTGANDVYVVRGERGELLLPAIDDVVRQIDLDGGCLLVELLPGLEFRTGAAKTARKPQTGRRRRPSPA